MCVGCLGGADCAGDKPICDATARACRPCAAAGDCPSATPVCVPSGACHECSAGNIGACGGAKALCDTASDHCVGCLAAADCGGIKPICDGGAKTCRGCGGDGECGGVAPACLPSGACGQCSATNKSACPAARPLCDVAGGGVCVGCVTSSDCSGPTPFCSAATHTCIPCTADGAPSCADPARPYCQTTGALAGACTQCTAAHADLCGGAKPRCLTDLGICGCSNLAGDGDCGNKTSGLVCNGAAGICVPGCSAAPGRNGCPAGQTCSDTSGGVGACSPTGGCAINGDCVLPTTACDTSVTPHQCVQCLSDAACALPLVCSTTAHVCVECTPANSTACLPTGNGGKCLDAGTCGCAVDGDCGGAASGRICDGATHKCTIGCRGSGGNGCPMGLACTSPGAVAGQCRPPSDGGTGDAADGGGSDLSGGADTSDGASAGGGDATGDARAGDAGGADGRDAAAMTGDGGGSASDGRDGALAPEGGGGGDVRADGASADGSGQRRDGQADSLIGDAGIGTRVYNLAGGGCQCALQPAATRDAAPIACLALLAVLLTRRRRR
ncbi:MAG TPA: hypothetical protein VMU50_20550 [Polyangia bacterium]|nr:hypothetical protein [Polyangia bacterium]